MQLWKYKYNHFTSWAKIPMLYERAFHLLLINQHSHWVFPEPTSMRAEKDNDQLHFPAEKNQYHLSQHKYVHTSGDAGSMIVEYDPQQLT